MGMIAFLSTLPWWVPITGIFGINIVFYFVTKVLYKVFYPKIKNHGNKFLTLVFKVFYRPVQAILWVLGLSIMVSLYAGHFFNVAMIGVIKNILQLGAVVCVSWAAFLFCRQLEVIAHGNKQFDKTTIELFSKLSFLLISLFTVLMALPLFGFKIAGLLGLFGGSIGIVLGFGAKDTFANIFGGIIMSIEKPFKIGEWIYNVDESIEGVVEHIGWRLVVLRQFDKRPLYIPNNAFSTMTFINASRMTNRRIQRYIGIRYCDSQKLDAIFKDLREYIKNRPDLDHSLTNYIHVFDFEPSAMQLKLRVYTKSVVFKDYMRVTEEILLDVKHIIEKHGGEIAFPTTTLDIPDKKELAFSIDKNILTTQE